jgi:hypothetical protein
MCMRAPWRTQDPVRGAPEPCRSRRHQRDLLRRHDGTSQVVTLDITNGQTALVTHFDSAAGSVLGAAATPEPATSAGVCLSD